MGILSGSLDGNWAVEWQNAHKEGVDWYNCSSAQRTAKCKSESLCCLVVMGTACRMGWQLN